MAQESSTVQSAEPFTASEIADLLEAAAAAPSLYNSQPWQFVVTNRELRIFADPERRSPHADPENRQQTIACGAVLLNARLAVQALGHEPHVLLWPDIQVPEHIATVRRGNPSAMNATDRKLYAQIPYRHTNREQLGVRPISHSARQNLRYLAAFENVRLRPIDSARDRDVVKELLLTAIRRQRQDLKRSHEMARWLRDHSADDGMPIAAWRSVPFPVPGLNPHGGEADWERQVAKLVRSHEFFLLCTHGDGREEWLAAGQGLQRVLLKAASLDLGVSFFNQIVEYPDLRQELSERLGPVGWAQVILRIGYPTKDPLGISGRRRASDPAAPA